MNIFSKLEQLIDLTSSEKTLVDFIKKYPYEFVRMSVDDICKYCFISKSTIYRLCKKLKLTGITELKMLVSTDVKSYVNDNIDYDFPIKPNQPEYEIVHSLENLYGHTIQNTKNLMDIKIYETIVQEFAKAECLDIYTSAGNIFFAENFQFQMAEIGKNVSVPHEEYQQHLLAAKSDKTHIAIIISFNGRSRFIDSILSILKGTKTKIVLITSTLDKRLKNYADYILYMSSNEDHYNKISSFSTRLSLLYILDTLYAHYFQLEFTDNIKFKTTTYRKMTNLKE